ncbi:hypothetical protein N7474_001269 [Penicillium riverlandense]|uniref:uncharacterized protein n=1 Tax=Penicillium riverlandense TaxID=1903569 RepID=UPI0025474198|nr:uncharacterized protein N7474_001269 [Penicillium riverlandense]KAJ5832958.1 hypothetical protein N7474_001269 [Penicillium riverlandense]
MVNISDGLLRDLTLFSEYSAAATCEKNFNSTGGKKVTCDPGICPRLERSNTEILASFQGQNPGNTTGFIALDRTHKSIVLAFRGSEYKGNYETDIDFPQVPVPDLCSDCMAHEGFLYAWGNISATVLPIIQCASTIYPDYRVTFTGHSLGGALSTLGALFQRNANHTVDLYTFGSPQVGNHSLAEVITDSTLGLNYRVTHSDDPVPRILATSKIVTRRWQYSQSSPEYWITSNNTAPVNPSDIEVIEGIDNKTGNLGQTGCDYQAHSWYIGNMTGCSRNGGNSTGITKSLCAL